MVINNICLPGSYQRHDVAESQGQHDILGWQKINFYFTKHTLKVKIISPPLILYHFNTIIYQLISGATNKKV